MQDPTGQAELHRATAALADAFTLARAVDYRPGSRQMRNLWRAEQDFQRARRCWLELLDVQHCQRDGADDGDVLDLRRPQVTDPTGTAEPPHRGAGETGR